MIQEHGGNIYKYADVIDFSANINPLGTPHGVIRAVEASAAQIGRYPDPDCTELTKKLSLHENIPAENIVCGNGAADLIYRIAHAYRPKNALIFAPTFGEYRKALTECGCTVREYTLHEERYFIPESDILGDLTADTDIAFLCTPNNPTGQLIPPQLLSDISERCRKNNILLVCDECFLGFAENSERYSLRRCFNGRSIILKAFTKLFAVPGLRIGYAVCGSPDAADSIRKSGQHWSVSIPAQNAGIAALDEADFVNKTVGYVKKERAFLRTELSAPGIRVFPSAANYIMLKAMPGLDDLLLSENILIRNCSSYSGLSGSFYRIAVRTHEENMMLISALRRCMNG
ncbi:MAG: aminotransferase class I/II-fold pyridoxal phosphate-dependent enzyme [Ruminococcus sp.]|nr:aminotransferase class I/II-fold pyridoxal phosphate-dependent enzyme [Ruminococcus sp.]